MNPETRKAATVILGCFGFIALCFLLFYAYIVFQFAEGVADLGETINRQTQNFKYEKLYPARYGERQVIEISEKTYQHEKEFYTNWNKLQQSKYAKENEKIVITTDVGLVSFEDNYDNNCMACVKSYEIKGDNLELKKTVVESGYYQRIEYQMIDWKSGQIDTLFGLPSFNLTNNFLVSINYNSKDSLAHGVQLYEIKENEISLVRQIGKGWHVIDCFWGYANELYCEAFLIIDGKPALDNKKYIRIHNVLK